MVESDDFEGTIIENKDGGQQEEVDVLIQQTLEEARLVPKASEKKTAETGLAGTPISIVPPPAPEPAKSQAEEKPKYEETFKTYQAGDIIKGKIAKIDPIGVLVDIGYKSEGLIPAAEFSDVPAGELEKRLKIGDEVEVFIEKLESKEGYVILSKKHADREKKWRIAYDAYKNRKVLEAKVVSVVKGGLVVDCEGIRGFIPASQVVKKPEAELAEFVGKNIPIKVIEIDRRQGRVVLSHKLAAAEKQRFEAEKLFDEIEVGQIRHGTVTSIKKFGAFVDLGGVEGLIPLSEISWKRVSHPSEVLKVGDETDCFVLGIDREKRKISLGLKELQPDPWVEAEKLYKVGEIVKGRVARLAKFGAFVELEKGLEGLVHISELSITPVSKPEDAVKPGDEVQVKILRILPEEQKIGLSIREVLISKEKEKTRESKKAEEEKKAVTIGDILKEKEKEREQFEEEATE